MHPKTYLYFILFPIYFMPFASYFILLFFISFAAISQDTLWTNVETLGIEGKGFANTEHYYDRLPKEAKNTVREGVWNLSHHSAGMLLRFYTNAPQFFVKWQLIHSKLELPHIAATGVSGIDMYVLDNANTYLFMGCGIPKTTESTAVFKAGTQANHSFSYLLNFPLYNGIKTAFIGIPKNYILQKDTIFRAVLPKPVVFYGTSILQGACASRAGMSYPSILGRKLGFSIINLGFSGNAKLEPVMQDILAQIDASIYVIDCQLNTTKDETQAHTEFAIRKIRKAHPQAPIIIIEGSNPTKEFPTEEGKIAYQIIKKLKKEGFKQLYYVEGSNLLGNDTEGTVDLVHPNDLGHFRYAENLQKIFKKVIRKM